LHSAARRISNWDCVTAFPSLAEDFVRLLADTIHASRPLDEAYDRPWQVVIHDDGSILKVLTLTPSTNTRRLISVHSSIAVNILLFNPGGLHF
jgi:hypothetical protein